MMKKVWYSFLFICFGVSCVFGQELKDIKVLVENKCTAVKSQGYSGTCWSFASVSFIESEIKRKHDVDVDLSEWFVVRHIYPEKIRNYIRTQGNTFITAGGQIHDVLWVMKYKGLLPEEQFSGPRKEGRFNSADLDTAVMHFTQGLKWDDTQLISTDWEKELDALLNTHLGSVPSNFECQQKKYDPVSFRESLGIEAKDYIQITSFNHHEYYEPFALESRFNWSYNAYMNLPLDEYITAMDSALLNGYTVALNVDISEENFKPKEKAVIESAHSHVDQQLRQELFENGQTRIDHIMHIVGIAEDQEHKKYYITKNSWGEIGPLKGYVYLSEDYIRSKAMSLVLHKAAIPGHIAVKLGQQ